MPAGTYESAYRVDQTDIFSGTFPGAQTTENMNQSYLFVEGVGMVKNTVELPGSTICWNW